MTSVQKKACMTKYSDTVGHFIPRGDDFYTHFIR